MKFVNTNRRFFFILVLALGFLASQSGITGLPPTTLQGWFESAKRTTFNFFVPNKQATKVSGGTLIETGNNDLLENSNFENTDVDHAWTVADASISAETSDVFGKQALKLVYIGDPVNLYQDSTINAMAFADGVQGLLHIKVKNNTDKTLYACPRNAGATAAISECLTIPNDNTWFTKPLHILLGATSNGIALTSNGEFTTGTILVDEAFLGTWDIDQDTPVVSTNSDTDWQSCTPSSYQGFGTVSNVEVFCKRQGSELLYRGKLTTTSPTDVEGRIGLPAFQGAQLVSAGTDVIPTIQKFGTYTRSGASTASGGMVLQEPSVSYFTLSGSATFGSTSLDASAKANVSTAIITSGQTLNFTARIPIDGWENSNVIVGSFKDFDYVYVEARGNGGQVITNAVTDIPFTEVVDTHAAWDGSLFTAPLDGVYAVDIHSFFTAAAVRRMDLYLGGSVYAITGESVSSSNHHGTWSGFLTAGQTISVRTGTNGGTLSSAATNHWITITRIPGQL